MIESTGRTRTWVGLLVVIVGSVVGGGQVNGAANPRAGKIVFEGDRAGVYSLSVMRPDGSNVADFSGLPTNAADAAWSPNGKLIAFEADPDANDNLEVFVMNADGTNVRQLTDSPGWDYWPAWFPNGKHIVFTSWRSGVPNLWIMDADGANQRPLTDDTELGSFEPHVSPNGHQIVFFRAPFDGPPTIWVINADGTDAHPITFPGDYADLDPQWSPNGQRIVFASDRTGAFDIYSIDPDGFNLTNLTASPGQDFDPVFSPDGRQIAFWKFRFGQGDIWVMNADGSDQTNVTNTPGKLEGFPDWHQGNLK